MSGRVSEMTIVQDGKDNGRVRSRTRVKKAIMVEECISRPKGKGKQTNVRILIRVENCVKMCSNEVWKRENVFAPRKHSR